MTEAAAFEQVLARVARGSPFVAGHWSRHPEWREHAFLSSRVDAPALQAELAAAIGADDAAAFPRTLRTVRNRELSRIAFRDLSGWAGLEEVSRDLSDVAEELCGAALERTVGALARQHGAPADAQGRPVSACILGMGKLGGHELNFSSDIDLIFCFSANGETARGLSNEEFFGLVVRDFTRLLTARTEDGFVYRVDWMLRPFGASGPPAMHFDAMEEYYQVHGREWERYALIKARPVAGDRAGGEELLQRLQPFIYRRYFDFNAIGALRELKRKIGQDVQRKELHDNIKLGAGGIREIEFIAQAFQLMRGGPEADLRGTQLLPVLRHLGEAGHLPAASARRLEDAYVFLRRVENAIQMYADEQVHAPPESAEARDALCAALDVAGWPALETKLRAVRDEVQQEFQRLFTEPDEPARTTPLGAAVAGLWSGGDPAAVAAALGNEGFGDDAVAVVEAVQALRQSPLTRTLSETSAARLEALVVLLLEDALGNRRPGAAALRTLRVIQAVAGRATYLTLLRESGPARSQLVRLCAASAWITELIARSPILLDQLLDERSLYAPPDRERMRVELDELMAPVAVNDVETSMNLLRRFQQEVTLRVAAADVVEVLPLVKISDRLTWLAEVIVAKTLERVRADLLAQHGEPVRADGQPASFVVVAYGKFGSIEMGYGSDLDIIFLHDCDDLQGETRGGGKPLANEVWLSRLAQRLINWLSARTAAGRAYDVDLELRPDGRRGLTVSSIAAFEAYQKDTAWVWEHQALTRARGVAGAPALCAAFERLRKDILCLPRDPRKLRDEVAAMRARMRAHLDKSTAEVFDVKQGKGGLTDVEFMTQYLLLREAHARPDLAVWPDIWRQLESLAAAGVLKAGEVQELLTAQRAYREFIHRCRLDERDTMVSADTFTAERAAVAALWDTLLG